MITEADDVPLWICVVEAPAPPTSGRSFMPGRVRCAPVSNEHLEKARLALAHAPTRAGTQGYVAVLSGRPGIGARLRLASVPA